MKYIIFIGFLALSVVLANCFDETKAYAESRFQAEADFKKDPIMYYKRWALMYCLGYTSNENATILMPRCAKRKEVERPNHINNMVKILGEEPLEEIKAYVDREMMPLIGGRVNGCFFEVYHTQRFQETLEKIVKKYDKK